MTSTSPSLEPHFRAVEKVRGRLRRATRALENSGVPYAVIEGNAVAAWVGTKDEAAVRVTQDVDIALRRQDLDAARIALEDEGFVHRHVASVEMFLDGEGAKARDAIHVVFSGEKVRPDYELPVPDVDECERAAEGYRVLALGALVRMKLTSFRRKDQVHLQDLIAVGLVDRAWVDHYPEALAARLTEILDDPDG